MAPKRAAKKAAAPQPPPPPPPPPAESSDETRSGSRSRSRSDDSEDEEAIADSPVPAATPALKNTPAPSQKGGESESSEEEEDDDKEEEVPVRAPPKNQPPPPQKKEDSETSGDDDDDDDEEEEEEEPSRAAPLSAPKEQPPQPQKGEDSDTSGDEGESDEEEAPPPKPAPKKEAAALKPAAAAETKKSGAVQRIWSTDDEVRILEALAAHHKQHGTLPQTDALMDVLAGKLDNPSYGGKELHSKVGSLRTRYLTLSKRAELPSKEHDRRVLDLSKMVWGRDKTTPASPTVANVANGHGRKGFEEMCELYPYLAEEVKELEAARPGMCKREFGKMDDDKARSMDEKIKKQRLLQIKVEMGRTDLAKEVTKALADLVDG